MAGVADNDTTAPSTALELLHELDRLSQASDRGLSLLDSLANGVAIWEDALEPGDMSPDLFEGLDEQSLGTDGSSVDTMWEEFSVDNYVPRPVRVSKPKPKRWTPEVTVPEPFSFDNCPPKKSKSVLEYEAELARRAAEEEAECNIRIRPTPVPASTRLSLLQKIEQKHPRSGAKKKEKTDQRTKLNVGVQRQEATLEELRAIQRMQEEQRARRAKMMLSKARAPADLDKRGLRREAAPHHYPFRPKINESIPDYDRMAADFESRLMAVRSRRQPTVPQPFRFRSDQLPSAKGRVKLDIEMDELQLPETRWPFVGPRTRPKQHPHGPKAKAYIALSEAASAPEPQSTRTTEVRAAAIQRREKERAVQREREAFQLERRRAQAHRLKPSMAATTLRNDVAQQRQEARRRDQRERSAVDKALELQYQAELALMKDRVERRPLLAERPIEV